VHVADLRRPSSSSRALPRRFQDRREAGSKRALRLAPSVHPRDRDCPHAAPCGSTWQQSGRLPSCLDRPGCPGRRPHERLLVRNALRSFTHRSHLGAAASCVSTLVRSAPRPASRRRLALRLLVRRDARCVRPTSAYSRSSYEHPRLVGSRCVMRLRACAIEGIACFTSERFASVGHTFRRVVTAVGVVFPSRCV
jgi:hypothetical protein